MALHRFLYLFTFQKIISKFSKIINTKEVQTAFTSGCALTIEGADTSHGLQVLLSFRDIYAIILVYTPK